jgi:hypothetical protein
MSKPKLRRKHFITDEIKVILPDPVFDGDQQVYDGNEHVVDERVINSQTMEYKYEEDILPADTNDRTASGTAGQAKSRTTSGKAGDKKQATPGTSKPKAKPVRDQVFICYSHKDDRWLADLQTHLKPYVRSGSVTAWSDKQIAPGSKWFPEIKAALASTKVAVLLVTPSFLASEFIHEHELTPLLKEAEKGNVCIIWIPVSACSYKETPLKDYQAAIDPNKPLAKMKKADRDEAWVRICEEIKKAVGGIPFELKLPNRSTLRTIEQLESGKGVTFDSVDELLEDLQN